MCAWIKPKTILPTAIVWAAACGGKEENAPAPQPTPPTPATAPAPAPDNIVTIINDADNLCKEQLNACNALVAQNVSGCQNRAQLAAIQLCIGESVQCVNKALTRTSSCSEAETRCREEGGPEIRICTRRCRNDFLVAQATCTSSQALAKDECTRRLNASYNNCRDESTRSFDACIRPARAAQTRCQSVTQSTFAQCQGPRFSDSQSKAL